MFFNKHPRIQKLKEYDGSTQTQKGKKIIFRVDNGKGMLQQAYGSYDTSGLYSLVFGDIPLIRFHGDEYMCPTCEKLISAGYGLEKVSDIVIDSLRDNLNNFISLSKALDSLTPLLGLLPSGFYALADIELYPTDGDGNFFWNINNTPKLNKASSPVYQNGNWFWEYPAFLLPSQPPTHYHQERMSYYCNHPECRAIAYNIGFHNVLLDGHHKAAAAALNGRMLKTLVIFPVTSFSFPTNTKSKLRLGNDWFTIDSLGISYNRARKLKLSKRLSEKETKDIIALNNKEFDNYIWSEELLQSAKKYPYVKTLAYIEWAGGLSDERLDLIIQGKEILDESQAVYLCTALKFIKHERFFDIAFRIGKNESYARIWYDIFKLLSTVNNELVEDFFIEFLVNDEGIRPENTKIANDYLSGIRAYGHCFPTK